MENNTGATSTTDSAQTNTPVSFLEILIPGPGIDFNDVRGAVAVALIEPGIVTTDTKCVDINNCRIGVRGKVNNLELLAQGIKKIRIAIGDTHN